MVDISEIKVPGNKVLGIIMITQWWFAFILISFA